MSCDGLALLPEWTFVTRTILFTYAHHTRKAAAAYGSNGSLLITFAPSTYKGRAQDQPETARDDARHSQ